MEGFSVSSILAGIIFGIIGLYLFRYGKKKIQYSLIFLGIMLMVYPYFITQAIWVWTMGIGLCFISYIIVRK